jgi:putative ABC transport system ATP-binding protein
LLDEPTAAADATTSRAIEDLLIEWCDDAAKDRALVWVSHDPQQNGRVGHRVLCIEAGRLHRPDAPHAFCPSIE